MKISYAWLKDHIDTDLGPEEVSEILTDTGLEVEGLDRYRSITDMDGVVLGRVITADKHPDADRLSVCTVDVGDLEPLDIVCGAPNVAAGQMVAVATVGAVLRPSEGEPFKIKRSKIRGAVSQGMICAEDELGLGDDHDGIMVFDTAHAPGTPLPNILGGYEDDIIEIGLTPNRTDAISHRGVARDLAAALSRKEAIQIHSKEYPISEGPGQKLEVEVKAADGVIRYAGIELEGVEVGPSPEFIQNRLRAIGLTPKNNVVDITNYVMHDLGQPLHAFDADRIGGDRVVVRRAEAEETFITLDGEERRLDSEDLMICDANASMCIAGVLGGLDSGVTEGTKRIFLESACFNPVSVRKSAKRHGVSTDSSFRFERGVDPNGTIQALGMAVQLLVEYAAARVTSPVFDHYPEPVTPHRVELDLDRATRLIGKELTEFDIQNILETLDISVDEKNGRHWRLSIPTYRTEVTRPADVVEEILRIYGYNNIEIPERWSFSLDQSASLERFRVKGDISQWLNGVGFTEIMNNSLSAGSHNDLMGDLADQAVRILNPLSVELDTLRQRMLWGILQTVSHNRNRQRPDLQVFEFGSVYRRSEEGFQETETLALAVTGAAVPEHWQSGNKAQDTYAIHAVIRALGERFGLKGLECAEKDALPGYERMMVWTAGDHVVGHSGIVDAATLKSLDVKQDVFVAELDWGALLEARASSAFQLKEVPKFPSMRRDLSLLLDKNTEFAAMESVAKKAAGPLMKEFGLFDVYEGKNLPEGKKSYAVSLTFLDPKKTLTDKFVDKAMAKVQKALESELGAQLRG